MDTRKLLIPIGVVVIVVLALGAYAGLCFLTGMAFVESYQEKVATFSSSPAVKIETTVDQGIFASRVTSSIKGGPANLIVTTDVDHMRTLDKVISAHMEMTTAPEMDAMIKTYLQTPPKFVIDVTGATTGKVLITGQLDPIKTNKSMSAIFSIDMPEPARIEVETDEEFLPSTMAFKIPKFALAMPGSRVSLEQFAYTLHSAQDGVESDTKLALSFKKLVLGKGKEKPQVIGPLALKLGFDNYNVDAARKLSEALSADTGVKSADEKKRALQDLLNASPGLVVSLGPSRLKTWFGEFGLRGSLKPKIVGGNPGGKGTIELSVPFTKEAKSLYGPEVAKALQKLVKDNVISKDGETLAAKLSIDGDKQLIGEKNIAALFPLAMAIQTPKTHPRALSEKLQAEDVTEAAPKGKGGKKAAKVGKLKHSQSAKAIKGKAPNKKFVATKGKPGAKKSKASKGGKKK